MKACLCVCVCVVCVRVCVCAAAGECMCQDRGRGGTGICQRSVSALGMNLISVIRFKSGAGTSSLSKVGFGLGESVQKPGTNFGKQRETIANAWRRLLLLLTFHLDPITTCRLAHERIFLHHLGALRSSQTCFPVYLPCWLQLQSSMQSYSNSFKKKQKQTINLKKKNLESFTV